MSEINKYNDLTIDQLPAKFKPLSAWSYFWHSVLFSVPIVGLVFLIIFAIGAHNVNKRSFARSYFCVYILFAAIGLILFFTGALGSVLTALLHTA